MKIIKIAFVLVLVVPMLPVWFAGFIVKLITSAFTAGGTAYVDFYSWVGGR